MRSRRDGLCFWHPSGRRLAAMDPAVPGAVAVVLAGEHPRYQVIELDIDKHEKDKRPESYRPKLETTGVSDQLAVGKRRSEVLDRLPLVLSTVDANAQSSLVASKTSLRFRSSRSSIRRPPPHRLTTVAEALETGRASHDHQDQQSESP